MAGKKKVKTISNQSVKQKTKIYLLIKHYIKPNGNLGIKKTYIFSEE